MGKIKADKLLRDLKPQSKSYTVGDGEGLSLLIKSDGVKLWEFRYTSPTLLKRRKTSFGRYPDTPLKEARDKARECRELIAKGMDPIDNNKALKEKTKVEQSGIFDTVVREWFEKQRGELAKSTYTRKVGQFENDVIPFFKGRTISSIKHPEIVKVLELKAIKAPESANRLFAYLSNLWKFAIVKGYCEHNIIANIHKRSVLTPPKRKHYPKITDIDTLRELVTKIYSYKGEHSTRNALKIVLHIPLRAENLTGLQWDYVDFEKKLLTIPRASMKVKNKNFEDYQIPLTDQVIEILREQKLFSNGRYILKACGYADVPICNETPNRALERMGFNDEAQGKKIRLHGFRGTFRSLADTYQEEHGVSYEAKERALDHFPSSIVERAYTHKADYIKELRGLMRWWSAFIDNLIFREIVK
jgi:integrase